MEFISRDYHYRELARQISSSEQSKLAKGIKILNWTHENIREVPEGFPVIDDHILNIIIRGYGTMDQSADVFTTLCSYSGIPAFWSWITPKEGGPRYVLSFVKVDGKWLVFDSYLGQYFLNKDGSIASIEDLIKDDSIIKSAKYKPVIFGIPYERYFNNLGSIDKEGFSRAKKQMPLSRLIIEVKERF